MKILVTGANGFLATHIIEELLTRNYEVRGMMRSKGWKKSPTSNIELFYGDITNFEDLKSACKGCDIVIHTAATTDQNAPEKIYTEVNVKPTVNILKAARLASCKKLIYVSTANAFGYGDDCIPGNENLPINELFRRSKYAYSKYLAQQKLLEESKNGGIEVVICNPTFMLGYGDSKPGAGRILLMYLKNKLLVIPPGGRNFVYVKDVAVGVCNAISFGKNGECYLLCNENMDYAQFFNILDRLLGLKRKKVYLSERIVTSLGYIAEILGLLGIKSELNYTNSKILCIKNYYSSEKAVRELKLPQTPLEKALFEAYNWFNENGYVKAKWISNQ